MKNDLRWRLGTSGHPKIVRLVGACGERAFRALACLWEWTAANRPDGNLKGMDTFDLCVAAGWPEGGEPFIAALRSLRLLDGSERRLRVHDWEEEQPWVAGSEERSQAARVAGLASAAARQRKANAALNGIQRPVENRSTDFNSYPSPSPSPTPTPTPVPSPAPVAPTAEVLASPSEPQSRNGFHPKPSAPPWANGGPVSPDSGGAYFAKVEAERRAKRAAILAKQAAGEDPGAFDARFLAETAYLDAAPPSNGTA